MVIFLNLFSDSCSSHESFVSAQSSRVARRALLHMHGSVRCTSAASRRASVVGLRSHSCNRAIFYRVDHCPLTRRRLARHVHDFLAGAGSATRPIYNLTIISVVVDGLTSRKVIILHDNDLAVRVLIATLLPPSLLHAELLSRVLQRVVVALGHHGAGRLGLIQTMRSLSGENALVEISGRHVVIVERMAVASRLALRAIFHLHVGDHLMRTAGSLITQIPIFVS